MKITWAFASSKYYALFVGGHVFTYGLYGKHKASYCPHVTPQMMLRSSWKVITEFELENLYEIETSMCD